MQCSAMIEERNPPNFPCLEIATSTYSQRPSIQPGYIYPKVSTNLRCKLHYPPRPLLLLLPTVWLSVDAKISHNPWIGAEPAGALIVVAPASGRFTWRSSWLDTFKPGGRRTSESELTTGGCLDWVRMEEGGNVVWGWERCREWYPICVKFVKGIQVGGWKHEGGPKFSSRSRSKVVAGGTHILFWFYWRWLALTFSSHTLHFRFAIIPLVQGILDGRDNFRWC